MTKDNNLLGNFDLSGIPPAPRGVPKIDDTFDIDANGILNVSAKDQSTGRSKAITITNDKGRLSKEDIDRMVREAEKYKQEDERQREKIAARNKLESYAYSVKQALEDPSLQEKVDLNDKNKVLEKVKETLEWLDNNSLADTDEFQEKEVQLQKICSPVMAKIHGAGTPHASGAQTSNSQGPTIEEVD